MANRTTIKDIPVSVGDIVRVNQISKEAGKERSSLFEGRVIAISGRSPNKSFTVRRIGIDNVGVEKIFPIASPVSYTHLTLPTILRV